MGIIDFRMESRNILGWSVFLVACMLLIVAPVPGQQDGQASVQSNGVSISFQNLGNDVASSRGVSISFQNSLNSLSIVSQGVNIGFGIPRALSVTPNIGAQNSTTFTLTGSNLTPNSTIKFFIAGESQSPIEIGSVTSNASGNASLTYATGCGNPSGSNAFVLLDVAALAYSSAAHVNLTPTTGCAQSPGISSLSPSSPVSSSTDQNISIIGFNFQAGLTVLATLPSGGYAVLSGAQVQNVTATTFTLRFTLDEPGIWRLRVNNPDGRQSNWINFTVANGTQSPTVLSLNPTTPVAGSFDQDIYVSGAHFRPSLTVDITGPGGLVTTLSGDQIQNVTDSAFIMRATLGTAGSWSIKAKNPDNQLSAAFPFTVANGGPAPFITLMNPVSPTATGADQYVTVTGGNFQNGLKVNATFPSGGIATLQGTGQIQNVTATSFKLKITLNTEGAWKIRVVNPDNTQSSQFAFSVQPSGPPPTGLPTSVLSPVIGPLRIIPPNSHANDGKWEFDQHKTGNHTATGGISLSNDTYAWDANLYTSTNSNADAGKAVFATAPGQVVSYVGTQPGAGPGAVLIAHPNATAPVWFSGYLHLRNVRVTLNDSVDASTVIGDVGRTGAPNEHLHFVVYSGTNTRGNLRSFNPTITERGTGTPPTVTSITPNPVAQSDSAQLITINGTNFQTDSVVEARQPNGQHFTITPETIALSKETQLMSITATAITVRVPFAFSGTYEFVVINRSTGARSTVTCSQTCVTVSPANSQKTPVVLIPGIMGSRIARWNGDSIGEELWPATAYSDRHGDLAVDVENPDGPYVPVQNRRIVASGILTNLTAGHVNVDFYLNMLSWLVSNDGGGRKLYERLRPISACNNSQNDADLFVFAYDWRNSNWTSARDLDEFIQCIRSSQGNPANFKVRIVAHSMGGLVARRYILNKKQNNLPHYVDRMVSLGTPWLGSPKFIRTLQNGWIDVKANIWINPLVIRSIAPNLRGAHELIPSYVYTDQMTASSIGSFPLGEDGWDFNNNQRAERDYDFATLKAKMNQYGNSPGTHTDGFHSLDFDDWNRIDTGVDYYNFYGRQSGTVGSLQAFGILGVPLYLSSVDAQYGDGTVPEVSSRRFGLRDYRGPRNIERRFDNTNHGDLASTGITFSSILCAVQANDPTNCLDGQSPLAPAVDYPFYNLRITGPNSVVLADSFGNTSDSLNSSIDEGITTIATDVASNASFSSTIPLDQTYGATITVPNSPISISVLKNDGQSIAQAIRYADISLPPNVLALIQLSPQGVTTLAYDSNGDGTFDTLVNPTINVTGTQAQDIEAPLLFVNETVQGGSSRIDLEATDTGTGVQRIMYSLNGTTFQQYTTPLTLNPAVTPTIYAYADDNVFNRTGLVTHNLTASNAGFSVGGPSSAPAGGQATASWNAPTGRPVDDWIGLFRNGTLNSSYVAKQYTNGTTSGNLNFVVPNQPGTYEFRYLLSDGFTSVAASSPFTVGTVVRTPFDFDGDSKSDLSIFRPAQGEWWVSKSSNGGNFATQFGTSTDTVVPADFTGDGKTDVAYWRPTTGFWYVLRSEDFTFYAFPFGAGGDVPVPADFDGDGKADAGVFRPSAATWYISRSSGGTTIQQFGLTTDKPVPADYDGDGKADLAVYRPTGANGAEWWISKSSGGTFATQFGSSTDKAVPADYTGDGKADIAFWIPSTGQWFILRSEDLTYYAFPFGGSGDAPVPGDYDGDGKTDAAVFRPSNSTWYANRSTAGVLIQQFGQAGDLPLPNAYVR